MTAIRQRTDHHVDSKGLLIANRVKALHAGQDKGKKTLSIVYVTKIGSK